MKKLLIPAFCAAALAFTGCINDFNEDDFIMTTPALMENITLDGDLANQMRVIQTSKMKTEQGVEVVCVRARLKREDFKTFVMGKENTFDISYKFTWFDAQGKEVFSGKWQSLALKPGAEFACTSTAPAKGITKVSLSIRRNGAAPAAVKPAAAAKKAPAAVKQTSGKAAGKNTCLCGCAQGEKCYCPEGSACPNAGKNKKK